MTIKTKIPGSREERALDERFERGDMFRIIKTIHEKRSAATIDETKKEWGQKLKAALEISRNLTSNLDTLNRQYYSPQTCSLFQ
jgi:hypothetical protein